MSKLTESYFVSDLHLHSRRSSGDLTQATIDNAVLRSHTFILGGDIFDFRWRTQATLEHSIDESIDWLRRLIALNRQCNFHYLLGNHDANPHFIKALSNLCESEGHLVWHPHYLRLGDCAFLHGDIVDAPVRPGQSHHDILDRKRRVAEERLPPSPVRHQAYDWVVRVRLHKLVVQVAKRNRTIMSRILNYLNDIQCGPGQGVHDVYFGHTHRGLDNARFRGVHFHNPGAAIKGLPFRIVVTRLPSPEKASE
jgi:UDP-2,3-diacylglucosamine hydrolase